MTGRALPGPTPRGLGLWWVRASRTDLLGLLQRLQQAHGPLCVTRVLNLQVADVFDPALARTLLVEHAAALQRWPRLPEVLARYHGPSSLLVAEEASAWQPLHDALVPAFAPRALEGLAEVIAPLAAATVEDALAGADAAADADGGVEVDRLFTHLTIQVVERWLFGANRWTENEVTDVATAIRILGGLALRELFIPWAWLRRFTSPANRRRRAGLRVLNAMLLPRLGEAALLQGLPPVARADNLRTMFAAGHDTTAQALAWWCALMAHHPAALARAQSELDTVLAGRAPTTPDLARLPWLMASVKEALRLYPAVPVLAMRYLRTPVTLGDWTLPAGTLVRIAPWMLHRDAQAWPLPEAFQPERFLPEAPPPARGAWLPFGAGPRACIGRPLALLEMTTVAAVLLQRCTPRPLHNAAMPAPDLDLVLRPRQVLRLLLAPRPGPRLPLEGIEAGSGVSLAESMPTAHSSRPTLGHRTGRWVAALLAVWWAVWLAGCGHGPARLLASADEPGAPTHPQAPARVALVLSSGGLRGLAQLGVLRVLEAHGLRPDLIVGSSVGAIVGAAYAAGESGSVLYRPSLPASLDPWSSWWVSPYRRSQELEAFMARTVNGRRIEYLPRRFVAVATERRDGCIVLFGSGDAARAVAASSALPGVFAPVSVLGQTFADGGLAAPLPVRVAHALGAQRVIAVDTTFHAEATIPDTLFDAVFHAGMVMSRNLALPDRQAADVLIEPRLPPVAEVTLANRERLIAAGEAAALAQLPALRALFAAQPPAPAGRPGRPDREAVPLCTPRPLVATRAR